MRILLPKSVNLLENEVRKFREKHILQCGMQSAKYIERQLADSASRHSVVMEIGATYPFFGTQRVSKKEREKAMTMHRNAWKYALETVSNSGTYSPKDLTTIGLILEPHQRYHPTLGFRMQNVRISGASHQPPDAGVVAFEIGYAFNDINSRKSNFERAILTHYQLSRIHPLEDGNGRMARLTQNALLVSSGLLPVRINRTQRDEYLALLKQSDDLYYDGNSNCLEAFSEFMVHNMWQGLQGVREYCQTNCSKDSKK